MAGKKQPNSFYLLPEYQVWKGMKERCRNPNAESWENYGGRGIEVCERWRISFIDFYRDMGPRPSPDHTIEREDSNGHYEPNNCRWATKEEQARNKRSNFFVNINGKRQILTDASKDLGLSVNTLRYRLEAGKTDDKLRSPPEDLKLYTHNGLTMNLHQWSKHSGQKYGTIRRRIAEGLSIEEAIKPVAFAMYAFNGESMSLADLARKYRIDFNVAYNRLNLGWSIEDALTKPLRKVKRRNSPTTTEEGSDAYDHDV